MPLLPERPKRRPLTVPRADNGQRTVNSVSVRPLNMPVPSANGQQTAELPRTPSPQAAKSIRLPSGRVEPARIPLALPSPPIATVSKRGPLPAPPLPSRSVQRPLGGVQAPRQGGSRLELPERPATLAGGLSVPGASQAPKAASLRLPEASGPSQGGTEAVVALLRAILRALREQEQPLFDTVAGTPQPIQLARPMWGD